MHRTRQLVFRILGGIVPILVSGFLTTSAAGAGTCTTCDDPLDVGDVAWCDATACITGGSSPHLTSGQAGYCPALYERIQEDALTGCGPVTITSTSTYSYCDGGNRVYMGKAVGCAYTVHAENTNRGKIKDRWYSGGGIAIVGMPTSQAYKVPGTGDLWYQMFEFGAVVNNDDGSDAHYLGADTADGAALKEFYKDALAEERAVQHFGMFPKANSAWDADAATLYVLFQDDTGRVPHESAAFARDAEVISVSPDLYPRYADYDPNVADPDLFKGYLGRPVFEQAEEAGLHALSQAFENGLLLESGAGDKSQACILCDDTADGLSNVACRELTDSAGCLATGGCQWDGGNSLCVGAPLDHCSPSPGGTVCPTLTTQSACDAAQCTWDGPSNQCYNPETLGAIAGRIAEQGWAVTDCPGNVSEDPGTGWFSQVCNPGSGDHRVVWSPKTECAYVLHAGSDERAKIRAKYETPFPARLNLYHYYPGDIRASQGNLYVATNEGWSATQGGGPGGTDPATTYADGTVKWRFLAPGSTQGDLLGPPTSEAKEIGSSTGHWVQYFEHGALVFKSGDPEAYRIGDPSVAGHAMKYRWQQDERRNQIVDGDLFPTADMGYLDTGGAILWTGTASSPTAYFAFGTLAHWLGAEALAHYADYDDNVANPDYAHGYLGWPVGDQSDGGGSPTTWEYVELQHGVITNWGGAWDDHATFPPQDDYTLDDGSDAQAYCMKVADHELAMEMRRIKSGWLSWSGSKTSYIDDDPLEPPFLAGYYRMAGANRRVVYSVLSNAGQTECAYALAGRVEAKWATFSATSRQNYGYPTSAQFTIYDGDGTAQGEAVLLQNGAIIFKNGDPAAYVLGADSFTDYLPGRALKDLWRFKVEEGVVHDQGYYLDADAAPGSPTNSGYVAVFEGINPGTDDGDDYGRRFAVAKYNCGQYTTESACPATRCKWGTNLGAEACVNRAFEVRGTINRAYRRSDLNHPDPDYEAGALSYPTSERLCGDPDCTWVYQNFLGGQSIRYQNPGIGYVVDFGIAPCYQECNNQTSCTHACRANFNGSGPQTCGAWGSCIECNTTSCPGDGSGVFSCDMTLCDQDSGTATDLTSCADWRLENLNDGDSDGIDDAAEQALAEYFRPVFHIGEGADMQQWIGADVEHAICPPAEPECQQPYTVREFIGAGDGIDCAEPYQCIEITYANLFNYDRGDERYVAPRGNHLGDSEHYALLIARKNPSTEHADDFDTPWTAAEHDPSAWFLVKEFFAAHRCFSQTGPDAEYSRIKSWMGQPLTQRNRNSEVWVAEGKHAGYPTRSRCEGASAYTESCDNRFNRRMDPAVMVNVGEERCHPHNDHIISGIRGGGTGSAPGDKPPVHEKSTDAPRRVDVWDPNQKYGESTPIQHFLTPGNIKWATGCWSCGGTAQNCSQFLWFFDAD